MKWILILYALGFSACLWAETYTPICPDEIKIKEDIRQTPKEWEAINGNTRNFLNGISFYSDHPGKMASLKPEFINNKKAKWIFSPQEIIYIVCHYNQTSIELTQPLPKKITACMIQFNQNLRGDRGYLPDKILCIQ